MRCLPSRKKIRRANFFLSSPLPSLFCPPPLPRLFVPPSFIFFQFPGGKIPAFAGPNNFNLTEGAAIAYYCEYILSILLVLPGHRFRLLDSIQPIKGSIEFDQRTFPFPRPPSLLWMLLSECPSSLLYMTINLVIPVQITMCRGTCEPW